MTRSISAYLRLAVKPIDTSERTRSHSRFERQISNRLEDLHQVRGSGIRNKRILSPEPRTPNPEPLTPSEDLHLDAQILLGILLELLHVLAHVGRAIAKAVVK